MSKEQNFDKDAALSTAIKQLRKQFGDGAIMRMGEKPEMEIEVISTGSLNLDRALGVGGLPKGRIIEMYGPEASGKSTLAMHCVAEAQKQGCTACYIDAEHAMDPAYAASIGVDIDSLLISQPTTGEEGLEICDAMVRSGCVDIIVVDSVAALVPKSELDGEMGDASVGVQARLMSQALRKLTASINKSKCIVIFINQLRMKIGVMYGCLHGETLVNFVDGRSLPIKKVVEEQIEGDVWSYNEDTKEFEPKKIIDWHYNGDVRTHDDYIHIETKSIAIDSSKSGGGRYGVTVTPDHKILTNNGWKAAKDLTMVDKLVTRYNSVINGTLADFLWGTLVGDSTLQSTHGNTASLRLQDSKNESYVQWKMNKLSCAFNFTHKSFMHLGVMRHNYSSQYTAEFMHIKEQLNNRDPLLLLTHHYSDLGLAVWYMDDGSYNNTDYHNRAVISVKRFKNDIEKLTDIQIALQNLGFDTVVNVRDGSIRFTSSSTNILFDKIARYIPECMQYKLPDSHKGRYEDFSLTFENVVKTDFVDIVMIRNASDKQMKMKGKYDISVEDNHNYMAGGFENGIIVHNSPETTTGGNSLKYYSSVRLDIRRTESLKNGTEVYGNHVRVKVVKNKVAPPFREAEFDIIFGKGISKDGEIIDAAIAYEIIQKSGAWFSYSNEETGRTERWQGRERVKEALAADDALREEIESAVVAQMRK